VSQDDYGPPKLQRAWQKFLTACVEEARAQGAVDPQLYFETSGLVVTDGPPHDDEDNRARYDRVVFTLPWPRGLSCDVGAW